MGKVSVIQFKTRRRTAGIKFFSMLCIFMFCFMGFVSSPWANEKKKFSPSCPDQNTLGTAARIALFEAQKKMGEERYAEAKKVLEKFLADHPNQNHPYIGITLGSLYLRANALTKARIMFEQCIDSCSEFSAAWQNLGKVCYDLKEYKKAAQAFDKVYEMEEKPMFLYHGAVSWMAANRKELAFEKSLFLTQGKAGPPKKEWVELMVHLAMELKRSKEAVPILENLLAQPEPPAYLLKLATVVYLEQNSYRKAAQALSAYSMLEELKIREMQLLADLLHSQGIPLKAAVWYEKVYRAKPNLKNCLRLASCLHEGYAGKKALDFVEKGILSYPDSYKLWRIKAWICYGEKNFKESSHCFSKVAKLNKKDTKSLFMSGVAAYRAGEKERAKKVLKLVADKKKYTSQAKSLIRQIDYEIMEERREIENS